ncbi:MAG: amino acid ABC transporter permease [Lachnospiraceae bacterium]|nr:amino acid ABC transporter permease [Lachnospiraceae bacterium]
MDTQVLLSYLPRYLQAFCLTVQIGAIGILIAFFLGMVAAFVLHFQLPILSGIFRFYIELFRNTPLLVQLFFIYFGLPRIGIMIPAQACGALGLGLLGGSYMAESFRSGLDAVSIGQSEAALALGMTNRQLFGFVIFPEAFALSIPSIVANVIFLFKETSVFSAISLMDLMFTAKDLIGLYYDTTEALFLLVIFYVIMILPVSLIGHLIEKKTHDRIFGA